MEVGPHHTPWAFNASGGAADKDESKFEVFPPHLPSSYLERKETKRLRRVGMGHTDAVTGAMARTGDMSVQTRVTQFMARTGADLRF